MLTAWLTICFAVLGQSDPCTNSGGICIVENGKARSVIVLSETGSSVLQADVRLLVRCIEKSTGAIVPVRSSSSEVNEVEIHIGSTAYAESIKIDTLKLDSDGFNISFPAANKIVIMGNSEWGVRFGIYEFLERYVRVRWLFPGELGEYVPETKTLVIQKQAITQEPAFWSRLLSSEELCGTMPDNPIREWAERLRMHGRIQFHHNLYNILPPSKYYNEHNDWYPPINGSKVCPPDGTQDWQPLLNAPGVLEESIKNVKQFFARNPTESSFSLGMNDSMNWGRSSTKLNSMGLADLSDYYYTWATKTASVVLEDHPDKWFGCLAYFNVADPPRSVRISPRIVPFITLDRMGWIEKNTAEKDRNRTIEWSKAAGQLGWYDYVYGDKFYKIPRIYWHLQAEYLKFANDNGVKAFYAEAYPAQNWTEGPKLYLLLKLLWNPAADVNAILDEWCVCAVGHHAAPYLKEYYELWERYWTESVTRTAWFRAGIRDTWLPYSETGYLEALEESDVNHCGELLKKVQENAVSEQERARAKFILDGFKNIQAELKNSFKAKRLALQLAAVKGVPLKRYDFTPVKNNVGTLPADWSFWSKVPGCGRMWWDKTSGHLRPGSLAIDANGLAGTTACFSNDTEVEVSQPYRITCWFKASGFSDKGIVGLVVKWKDKNGKWLDEKWNTQAFANDISGSSWKKITMNFMAVEHLNPVVSIQLVVQNSDAGIIRFDDVVIEKLSLGSTSGGMK